MRLAKLMAQRGLASRRKAEEMIAAGEVTVNGEVAVVTTPVDPASDVVTIKGQALPDEPDRVYYLLNKPRGYITGRVDTRDRQTVLDLVQHLTVRVEPVGRLDYDTEGALLFTNDGDLAFGLTHPSRGVEKVYVARVEGRPMAEDIVAIERGIPLPDGPTAPSKARIISRGERSSVIEITVKEGRNRMIRRMMAYLGHHVMDLRRQTFAGISLGQLRLGRTRALTPDEVAGLQKLAEKPGPKSRTRSKPKLKAGSKPKPGSKTKPKTKAKPKPRPKPKSKPKPKPRPKPKPKPKRKPKA